MKIVIDIPEWKYKSICEGIEASKRCGIVGIDPDIHEAIYNGTPLPKGHGDLIDRDKFKSLMDECFIDTSRLHYDDLTNAEHINLGKQNCLDDLDEMEPVIKADKSEELIKQLEEAERPQGKWVVQRLSNGFDDVYCPFCNARPTRSEYGYYLKDKFCHECGADMRGVESHLDNTPTVSINKDFYKEDKSNPTNRSDLFQ